MLARGRLALRRTVFPRTTTAARIVMTDQADEGMALEQLNLVLGFFPRVESMITVVLGIDLAMLGVLATQLPVYAELSWLALVTLIPGALLAASIVCLYAAAFPRLEGGNQSLVYFREIAARTEANFVHEFAGQQRGEYVRDVLGQVWRNAQILTKKYDSLKLAFVWLAWAVFPWAGAIAALEIMAAPAVK
jgi:hypothetical protein